MVSVTAGSTLSNPLTFRHNETDRSDYLLCWLAWEKESPPGGGEFRRIAVERLQACLEYKSATLDLADLELSSLPDNLPPQITTLILTNNQFTHPPDVLPSSLKNVYLGNNPLTTEARQQLQIMPGAGPVIHLNELQNEESPLINRDDYALQRVLTHGREIRLVAEEEIASRHWLKKIITPRNSLLATGIMAGVAFVSGAAIYLRRQWGNSPAPTGNTAVATQGINRFSFDVLPLAEPLMAAASASANITRPASLPAGKDREWHLINQLRNENIHIPVQPTKEELLSGIAGWLFPSAAQDGSTTNVLKLAKNILKNAGVYGGKNGEKITQQMAETVVRQWAINTLLGKSLRDYIAEKLAADEAGHYQTLASIKKFITTPALFLDEKFNINNIPASCWDSFETMWETFIKAEIPLLNDSLFKEAQGKKFTDYEFLALYTGAEFLAQQGALDKFTLAEIAKTGATIWGAMISGRDDRDRLPYLITPALWFVARSAPDLLKSQEAAYAQTVVPVALRQWQAAQEQANKIQQDLSAYQNALEVWTNKGALADKFVARCPLNKILYAPNWNDDNLPREQVNKKIRAGAKERYLLYGTAPCEQDNVPPSLNHEYQRVTENVSNAFRRLDRILVEGALLSASKKECDFICSPSSKIHPAFIKMRTEVQTEILAPTTFGGAPYIFILVELSNTELFAVINNGEERIYGLKKSKESHGGYILHRLDRNVRLYINNDVLNYEHFWKNYQIIDGKVKAWGNLFTFAVNVRPETQLYHNNGAGSDAFSDYFSDKHRQAFYTQLYQSGDVRSATENFWSALKPIIPFYGCIEGLASDAPLEKTQALFSCFLDVLSLVPVVGQATSIGGKFGLSLAQGMRSGVLKAGQGATAKAVASAIATGIALPAAEEMRLLVFTTLRALDPGIELLLRSGSRLARISLDVSDPQLAKKLDKLKQQVAAEPAASASAFPKAKLPVSDAEISIKQVGKNVWVQVNPETGQGFGKYYSLENNKLTVIEAGNSRAARERLAIAPVPVSPPVSLQTPVEYRQLPPLPGNIDYWNTIRGVTNWLPLEVRQLSPDNTIQPLSRFLPEPPLWVDNVAAASEVIMADLNHYFAPYPWRTWAGVNPYDPASAPLWLAPMQAALRSQAQQSLQTFQQVWASLCRIVNSGGLMDSKVGDYLMGILGTQQSEVIHEAFLRLNKIVKRGVKYLKALKEVNYRNFIIVSGDLRIDPSRPSHYISTLPDEHLLETIPFACVLRNDPESRIIFFADKFHNNLLPHTSITHDLNHEITHATSNTGDIFVHFYPEKGRVNNGQDVYKVFNDNFMIRKDGDHSAIIYEREDFRNFMSNLLIRQGISREVSEEEIFTATFSDPMLKANLMMSDAEVIATIVRDLAVGRPFDAEIRIRRATDALSGQHNQTREDDSLLNTWISIAVVEALRVGMVLAAQP